MYSGGKFVGDIKRRNKLHLIVRVQDPLGPTPPGVAWEFLAREARFDSRRLPNGEMRTSTTFDSALCIVKLGSSELPQGMVPAQAMVMFSPRRTVYVLSLIASWPFVKFSRLSH
jgi:hypothetical protein